jgi:hypothetical protein
MIAAIYARKSTDQNLPDAEKSVTRQVEHATAYATRKGWAVDPAHVDTDDAVSGAEFASGDSPKHWRFATGFRYSGTAWGPPSTVCDGGGGESSPAAGLPGAALGVRPLWGV